jgi:hypothetical protein
MSRMTKLLWESSPGEHTCSLHPTHPLLLYLATWMRKDYEAFLDLGPGATPQIS